MVSAAVKLTGGVVVMTARKILALRLLISFVAICGGGIAGFALPLFGARLALPILPSGIAVALAHRWGRDIWPAVFGAGMAIDLWTHQPALAAIGVGIGLATGTTLCAWLLERYKFDASFSGARDVPLFILAALLGITLLPTFGMLGFKLAGSRIPGSNLIAWLRWWADSVVGVLLVAPILMANPSTYLDRFTRRWKTGLLWLLVLALCCGAVLFAPSPIGRPPVVMLAVIVVVVGAIGFGLAVAALGAFAISVMAAASLLFSRGVLGDLRELQGLVTLWSLSAALTGLNFIITALLAERDIAAVRERLAERRYAEIFDGSPQPTWVYALDTLEFLVVNAAAVRQYGWTREEFLSSTIDLVLPPELPRRPADLAQADASGEPFETRHVTRAGLAFEAEVWTRHIEFAGRPARLAFSVDLTERRAFGQALIDAISGEQRRIGQEMHDGLGQELTGLALSLRALANRAQKERDAIAEDLDKLTQQASSCIADSRRIVQGLWPFTSNDSLDVALSGLAERSSLSGMRVVFRKELQEAFDCELKVRHHLYRIAQEAVQNALKHSGATMIEIRLRTHDGAVRMEISDDGLKSPSGEGGLGMRTMRFRASVIGVKLAINYGSGQHLVVCEIRNPETRLREIARAG
jgi:PAS domain S-box-containing protein